MNRSSLVCLLIALLISSLAFITLKHQARLTDLEIIRVNTRRSYFPGILGRLYENKITASFTYAKNVVFRQ